jgi:uncharacterized protein YoxC
MSRALPSVQQQRLVTVQRAAKHVLSLARSYREPFRSLDIFPADLGRAATGSSEHSWRGSLAWVWAQAGYLTSTLRGSGTAKHHEYVVTPEGEEALAQIAQDAVIASFYIPMKRGNAAQAAERGASWYQAPELRHDEEPVIRVVGSSAEDDEGEGDEPAETHAPNDAEAPGAEAPPMLGLYFERIIAVLERGAEQQSALNQRLGTLEGEIKAQSDFVLEVSGKLDQLAATPMSQALATRSDLGKVSGEIVEAIVEARTVTAKSFQTAVSASATVTGADITRVKDVLTSRMDSLAGDLMTIKKEVVGPDVKTAQDSMNKLFKRLDALEKHLERLEQAFSAPFTVDLPEDVDQLAETLSSMEKRIAGLGDALQLLDENIAKASAQRRELDDKGTQAIRRLVEAADAIYQGAKEVAKEVLALANDRAAGAGVTEKQLKDASDRVLTNIQHAESATLGRVSALGGGLIRNLDHLAAPITGIDGAETIVAEDTK